MGETYDEDYSDFEWYDEGDSEEIADDILRTFEKSVKDYFEIMGGKFSDEEIEKILKDKLEVLCAWR